MNYKQMLEKFAELDRRVKELEDKVDFIDNKTDHEDKKSNPVPLPSLPPTIPSPWTQSPPSSCPKCGIELKGVMGYCCPHAQCPTGLGGAWSSMP